MALPCLPCRAVTLLPCRCAPCRAMLRPTRCRIATSAQVEVEGRKPMARYEQAAALVGGSVYVLGGNSGAWGPGRVVAGRMCSCVGVPAVCTPVCKVGWPYIRGRLLRRGRGREGRPWAYCHGLMALDTCPAVCTPPNPPKHRSNYESNPLRPPRLHVLSSLQAGGTFRMRGASTWEPPPGLSCPSRRQHRRRPLLPPPRPPRGRTRRFWRGTRQRRRRPRHRRPRRSGRPRATL